MKHATFKSALMGVALLCGGLSSQVFAQGTCSIAYTVVSNWGSGGSHRVAVTNNGSAVNSWEFTWEFNGSEKIGSLWNGSYTQSGKSVSVKSVSWNGSINTGEKLEVGFNISGSPGATPKVYFNGDDCSGDVSVSSSSTPVSSSRSSTPSSVASSTNTTTSSSVAAGVSANFSDGFESETVGQQPSAWNNFVGWSYNNVNNRAGNNVYALVDNSRAYSGTKSIHFRAGAEPAQIVRQLPAGVNKLYMKAQVYMSKKLGNEPGDNHEHIFAIKATPDANNEVRFGQIKGVLGTNEVPSDNIAPRQNQWGSGPEIQANTWNCVIAEFDSTAAYDSLFAYVNNQLVHTIDSSDDWNNGALSANWLSGKFNYVAFGFHSFSSNSADVWMDDIVYSTTPLNCNGAAGNSSSSLSSASVGLSSSDANNSSSTGVVVVSSASSRSSVNTGNSSSASSIAGIGGAYSLNEDDSYLNFITIKKTSTAEAHVFTSLSGAIDGNGTATLIIDLNSVNTNNTTRDPRMREILFETDVYPEATVTISNAVSLIPAQVGVSQISEVSATVSLHGVEVNVETQLLVQRLANNRILVQNVAPLLVVAADYNLDGGVEALREVAGLSVISTTVPVDFVLFFDAN